MLACSAQADFQRVLQVVSPFVESSTSMGQRMLACFGQATVAGVAGKFAFQPRCKWSFKGVRTRIYLEAWFAAYQSNSWHVVAKQLLCGMGLAVQPLFMCGLLG